MVALNTFGAIGAAVVAARFLAQPSGRFLVPDNPIDAGDNQYLYMYSGRSLAISALTLVALALRARGATIFGFGLLGLSQLTDIIAAIAVQRTDSLAPPIGLCVVHLATAMYLILQGRTKLSKQERKPTSETSISGAEPA
ncbi:MAG: hypothetical protein HOQ24_13675 [Mycobacteriaceae bacterium]|nr:hypothetical protein [Mycobacteriaceae bacterium]